jgi:hypothetical protein
MDLAIPAFRQARSIPLASAEVIARWDLNFESDQWIPELRNGLVSIVVEKTQWKYNQTGLVQHK